MEHNEQRARLAVDGEVTAAGEFEIVAITAGEGNGWQFSEDCLRESLALWDGAECFIDHAWFGHSLRDLAGCCTGLPGTATARACAAGCGRWVPARRCCRSWAGRCSARAANQAVRGKTRG